MIRVAILVDEGYYRKRANRLFGQKTAAERATELEEYCKKHDCSKAGFIREAIQEKIERES